MQFGAQTVLTERGSPLEELYTEEGMPYPVGCMIFREKKMVYSYVAHGIVYRRFS